MPKYTGQAVEQLCGCRSSRGPGTDIYHRCAEAKQLLRETEGHDALDYTDPAWNAYRLHFDETENPVVKRQGKDGQWADA